jgi:SET domain-containing protein
MFVFRSYSKNDLIIEYIGQKIRQVVADRREAVYEQEGVGSCYLFRLDKDEIVDATRTGGMARFMNHCCEPNAYAGIVTIPSAVDLSVCQDVSTRAVSTDPHAGMYENLLCKLK